MSFTVQEARAAFFSIFALPRITLAAQNKSNVLHKTAVEPMQILATPATCNVQVKCLKENRNARKEIPQRIN
jgi:hypothetical protein